MPPCRDFRQALIDAQLNKHLELASLAVGIHPTSPSSNGVFSRVIHGFLGAAVMQAQPGKEVGDRPYNRE
jgi:hypothetical protein